MKKQLKITVVKIINSFLKPKKFDLVIYDDIYPHPVSGFRLEEFTILLSTIKNSKILLNPIAYPIVNTDIKLHPIHVNQITSNNLQLTGKLKPINRFVFFNSKLFYCIFINNIYKVIDYLEISQTPFVFTLYPGGGFQMYDIQSDLKLKRVLLSPMFKMVIVTQNITKDYLIANKFCAESKIKLIFGGVVPQNSLIKDGVGRKNYFPDKSTLDICFCAGKYMPKGIDKGYDVFIQLAKLLSEKYNFIKFHIIGGFNAEDIDVSEIKDKIKFYGYQDFKNLELIFKEIDIIISPNKSFVLNKGSFDGFPLGTIIEASLNGVLAIVTDDLNQNTNFKNNEELFITKSNCYEIEKVVNYLIANPKRIIEIAQKGKTKFQQVYSNRNQMLPRIQLLQNLIDEIQ